MKYENQTFENQTMIIDNHQFYNCVFNDCTLIYGGGQPPAIQGCHLNRCQIQFGGAAEQTVRFLTAMYHGGFKDYVEGSLDNIRKGKLPLSESLKS